MSTLSLPDAAPASNNGIGRSLARALFYLTIAFMCLMLVLPMIAFFINAFAYRWFYPQFVPHEWSLQAWERLRLIPRVGERSIEGFISLWAGVPEVVSALGISLLIGAVVTGVSIVIGLPAARVLGLYKFRGKRIIEFMVITPTIVPISPLTRTASPSTSVDPW